MNKTYTIEVEKPSREKVQCPVCSIWFLASRVQDHFNNCLIGANDDTDPYHTPTKSSSVNSSSPVVINSNSDDHFIQSVKGKARAKPVPNSPGTPLSKLKASAWMTDEDYAKVLHEQELKLRHTRLDQLQYLHSSNLSCTQCGNTLDIGKAQFMDTCEHIYCIQCLREYLLDLMEKKQCSNIKCPHNQCTSILSESTMKGVLTPVELQDLLEISTRQFLEKDSTCISCPNRSCRQIFQKVDQNREHIIQKLVSQKKKATEAEIHREQHRFSCRSCKMEFCGKCFESPYHEGKTCEQYKAFLEARHCRFCDCILPAPNKFFKALISTVPATMDVCEKKECVEKRSRICTKTHTCGHFCCGVKNEKTCLPCLHEDCAEKSGLNTTGEDFCNICFVESLKDGPCLQLKCGHIFHEACIRKKLGSKWPGARITFGFMDCPLCKSPMEHEAIADITDKLNITKNAMIDKCKRRIRLENIKDVVGKCERDQVNWAFENFAYYQCYRCGDPYYGGRKQCDANMNDGNQKFDEKELVCGGCHSKEFETKQSCAKHGREYLEYKCKFCCNLAVWYCWGHTHFCHQCHEIQCETHKLTKKPKNELPKCLGPQYCPVGGNHGKNGEEYALGCAICRRQAEEY